MAAKLLLLLTVGLLHLGSISTNIYYPPEDKNAEGLGCTTPNVTNGVCMNAASCDPAYLSTFKFEDLTKVCTQNAFYNVACCQPYLNFCEDRKRFQIFGGEEAPPGAFPHLARLGSVEAGVTSWKCSGSIVSQQFLLTAAHCRPATDVAGLGCVSDAECDQVVPVKNFFPHPRYKRSAKYHDIALVQLGNEIKFNKRVLPICPIHQTDDLPREYNLTIAGWGSTEKFIISPRLMFATVRTVKNEECYDYYSSLPPTVRSLFTRDLPQLIIPEVYCANGTLAANAYDYPDACQGDSGGPLQVGSDADIRLVGVISSGINCGSGHPGLYTRVSSYFNWIRDTIQKPPK